MRGRYDSQVTLLAFIDLETRVPTDHPLRVIWRTKPWSQHISRGDTTTYRNPSGIVRNFLPREDLSRSGAYERRQFRLSSTNQRRVYARHQ